MKKKIKILQVTGSLRIGGLENVAMSIIRYIDRELYDVRFLVYGEEIGEYEAEVEKLGGIVYHISFPRQGAFRFCRELNDILTKTGPYDIVHSHSLFPSGLVMSVAKWNNIPIRIAHCHTNRRDADISFFRRLYQHVMRKLIRYNATQFFACSNKAGEYLFGKEFYKDGFVMLNGVDINKFNVSEIRKETLKKDLGIVSEKIIGHTGRFVEVKNHKFLLEVFEYLSKNNDYKLLLVGDGPLKEDIYSEVKKKGLEDRVYFTGIRSDIPDLLSIMDVYVLPSYHEGVSVSLMEAQAMGVPFVVSQSAYSIESRVTEYGVSLNLDESINIWAETIVEQINRGILREATKIIQEKGYDVQNIVKDMQNRFYKI